MPGALRVGVRVAGEELAACSLCGASASRFRMCLAGTPPTSVSGGTSRVTTAPAQTTAPFPTVTPPRIVTAEPSQAPSPIVIGAVRSGPQRFSEGPIS